MTSAFPAATADAREIDASSRCSLSLLFASAHLSNYAQDASPVLLVLVVPQLIAGLIFGYARITYGLWSDMLLHMLHNGLLIGLVVLQKGVAG